jgi:hypothetical protein
MAPASLAELAVTTATQFVVDKVMDYASQTYTNAKKFMISVVTQTAYTAAAISLTHEIKAFILGQDLTEVVSGASLSFREFQASPTWIEAPGAEEPKQNVVLLIGPDLFTKSIEAGFNLFDKLKEGYSVGRDAATNAKKYKNINQAMGDFKKFIDIVKEAIAAATDLTKVLTYQAQLVFQSPTDSLNGCIFTGDPQCRQLVYASGFQPVYTVPQLPGGLGGLPVPIVTVIYNDVSGATYFGTPSFLPCTIKADKSIQCPNNPAFVP